MNQSQLPTLPVKDRLTLMRQVASARVASANGSPEFFQMIESNVETIATAALAKMAPVNENLLGFAMILIAELKRMKHG